MTTLLVGKLSLHDVDDVERLCRQALGDALRRQGSRLGPADFEDALAYLVANRGPGEPVRTRIVSERDRLTRPVPPPDGPDWFELLREAYHREDAPMVAALDLARVNMRVDSLTGWRQRLDDELRGVQRQQTTLRRLLKRKRLTVAQVDDVRRSIHVPPCRLGNLTLASDEEIEEHKQHAEWMLLPSDSHVIEAYGTARAELLAAAKIAPN